MKKTIFFALMFSSTVNAADPVKLPQYEYTTACNQPPTNIVDERRKAKQTKINIYQTQRNQPVIINITPTNNNSHIARRGKAGEKYKQTIGQKLTPPQQITISNGCIDQ